MAESHPLDVHIGLRLRRLRTRKGLSLERVGEWLDLSKQQLSRYEQGQSRLNVLQLYRLARGLGVPLSWFFEGFTDTPDEVAWVSTMLREERDSWRSSGEEDRAAQMVALWRMLPTQRQREQVIRLLESFVL